MAKQSKQKPDLPTQETLSKGVYTEEDMAPHAGAPKRVRRRDGTELDRLLFAGRLSPDDHTTLERFKRDLYRAGMIWSPKSAIVPATTTGQGQFMADNAFTRAVEMRDHFKVLGVMSRAARDKMLDAVMHDTRVEPGEEAALSEAASLLQQLYS